MTILAPACSPIFLAVAWPHESIAESPSISTVISCLACLSFVLFICWQNKHISITHSATPPLLRIFWADRRLWKAPLAFQQISFLWAKPPLGRIIILLYGSWQNDHSTSRSRITVWIARFPENPLAISRKRSWRTISAGSPDSKRICLPYSIFKEQSAYQPIKAHFFWNEFW